MGTILILEGTDRDALYVKHVTDISSYWNLPLLLFTMSRE